MADHLARICAGLCVVGALLLGQVMTPAMWLGALLIGAGVLLAVLRGRAWAARSYAV